ncbi:MAG: hypothetical protein ACYSWP_14225, partial [Planctomycetota bacterium]
MNPRERFLCVLGGGVADRIPFVIWNNKVPSEEIRDKLLDLEACIINKSSVYRFETPGVEVEIEGLASVGSMERRRKVFCTDQGRLSMI